MTTNEWILTVMLAVVPSLTFFVGMLVERRNHPGPLVFKPLSEEDKAAVARAVQNWKRARILAAYGKLQRASDGLTNDNPRAT